MSDGDLAAALAVAAPPPADKVVTEMTRSDSSPIRSNEFQQTNLTSDYDSKPVTSASAHLEAPAALTAAETIPSCGDHHHSDVVRAGSIGFDAADPPCSSGTADASSDEDDDVYSEHRNDSDGATAKELGIKAFREQRIDEAITHWQRGVRSCCYVLSKNVYEGDQKMEIQLLEMTLHLNLSLAHLKLGNYSTCVAHTDKVLSVDPKNVKALYRRGSALFEMCRFDEAIQSLDVLLVLEPDNHVARILRTRVVKTMSKAVAKEKRMMKQVFSSLESDPRVREAQTSMYLVRATLSSIASATVVVATTALKLFTSATTFLNDKCCKRRLPKATHSA